MPEAVPRAPEISAYEQNQERGENARGDTPIEVCEADAGHQSEPDRAADGAPADVILGGASRADEVSAERGRRCLVTLGPRLRDRAEYSHDAQERNDAGGYESADQHPSPFLPLEPLRSQRGEGGDGERHLIERDPRGARLIHVRHEHPPQSVEGRPGPQRDEKEQRGQSEEPADELAARPRCSRPEDSQGDHRESQVLAVKLESVRTPIGAVDARPREAGAEQLRKVDPRRGVGCGPVEPVGAGPRGERDVVEKRQHLDEREAEAQQDAGEGEREPAPAIRGAEALRLPERQVQREDPRPDQGVLGRLILRAEQCETHGQAE